MVVSLVVVVVVVLELLCRLYFVVVVRSCCFCCCCCFVEFWRLFVLSGGCFVLRYCLLFVLLAEPGIAGCISIFNINIFPFACQPKKKID